MKVYHMHDLNITDFSKYSTALVDLMRPFKPYGIRAFSYLKRYQDHYRIHLTTLAIWFNEYYNKQWYKNSPFESAINTYVNGTFICLKDNIKINNYAMKHYNIGHGILLVKKLSNAVEFYYFAGTLKNDQQMLNFFLNNPAFIQQFPAYFHDQADQLLLLAEKEKFFFDLPKHKTAGLVFNKARFPAPLNTVIKHTLPMPDQDLLTNRENLVLKYLLTGKNAKEMAKLLKISYRTVECHIQNIFLKLRCRNKSELLIKCLTHNRHHHAC